MKKVIPWLAFIASILISRKFCDQYWVVGPVFGAAVLVANYEIVRKKFSIQYILFLAASTLIYALIFWIADKGWKFESDALDMLAGSLSGAVVVGSLLMPFIHTMLLGADFKTAQSTALGLIAVWYVVVLLSWIDDKVGFSPRIDYIFIAIAFWQGLFLYRLKAR